MGFDDICGTGLALKLGFSSTANNQRSRKPPADLLGKEGSLSFEPSLTLSLPKDQSADHLSSSTYSNASVKRKRDISTEVERVLSSRVSDEDLDDHVSNGRKKLRLTKVQSALLEESFKQHSTLNPKQKQHLARKLNVRPRQVEVWFQNRRARTKLKQTEVDSEFLRKCCETLTDENKKLYKEVQELKALKLAQPLYMQLPAAATLTVCPSCERVADAGENAPTKPHFCGPFTNPSAAC